MGIPRLLVLEDEKNIADLVLRVAEEAGYDARAIRYLQEIPTLYEIFVPDVIILDIVMPGMDGFEVLQFLHSLNSESRIIIFSGQDDYRLMASRMAEGMNLPVVATVAKPFRVEMLRQTLIDTKNTLPPRKNATQNPAA